MIERLNPSANQPPKVAKVVGRHTAFVYWYNLRFDLLIKLSDGFLEVWFLEVVNELVRLDKQLFKI